MALRGLTRKQIVIAGGAVLVPCAVAAVTLTVLTQPSAGQLQHDDTLRTTKVDEVWQVKRPKFDSCMDIRFKGTVTGNARSTWGLGGPTTVWENVRLHGGSIQVKARRLQSSGECGDRVEMRKISVAQQWKTDDSDWRGYRQTRVTSGRASYVSTGYSATTIRLDGSALDRGESYWATLGLVIEPTWANDGRDISDAVSVDATVELPVD